MYHNASDYTFEVPDDLDMSSVQARITDFSGKKVLMLTGELLPGKDYSAGLEPVRLHLSNGVNHHYINCELDNIDVPAEKKGKK